MAKDDFDRELESYLNSRNKSQFNLKEKVQGWLPKRKEKNIEHVEPTISEEEHVHREEPQTRTNKTEPGFISKLFKRNKSEKHAEAITDMKEVSRIALHMIRELPEDQLIEFKQSEDFEKLKEILRKHELIR